MVDAPIFPETKDLFGSRFDCPCGKTHYIEPRQVVYADDAIARLPEVCSSAADGKNVVVLMDARTRIAAGIEVVESLEQTGWTVRQVLVEDPAEGVSPTCDDITKDSLLEHIGRADLLLPVGSGTINDLGKWLSCEVSVPYVCFATAASMNGYASSNIAATIQGLKSLLPGKPPVAVITSPSVISKAPDRMTGSGLGDVLAKSVSSADWYLNHLLFDDYYCRNSVNLIAQIEPLYLEHPQDIRDKQPAAIAALFQALLLTGAAMTMAETSAPASGAEHLISHSLDMLCSIDGREHDLHGRQVGVATILAAELYRRVLATESPQFVEPPTHVDRAFWGPLAETMAQQYSDKADRLAAAREKLSQGGEWDRLRVELATLCRSPGQIQTCLRRAGAAWRAADIGCDRERLLSAFVHANQMRSRFTVLDLVYVLGLMPSAGEIVEACA